MKLQSEATKEMILAPDGGDAWAPVKPPLDNALIRALARAHRWKRLLEDGTYRSAAEIAEAEGLTRSFVNRLLRLTLLAPDLVEAIVDGRQRKGMTLEALVGTVSSDWEEQRKQLCRRAAGASPCRPAPSANEGQTHARACG